MKVCNVLRAAVLIFFLPCLVWSANLTVTVNDANGSALSGVDVVAVSFSSMGPVGTALEQTNGSGTAVLSLENNRSYQLVAVKSGYLPSARDQMFNWTSSINIETADAERTIQLRPVTPADKVKDILITVTHDASSGNMIFLNLMNKGTYEQAGMGYFKSSGAGSVECRIYSAPTSTEDLPFQLDVFNPASRRGSRIGVNNKPDTPVADAGPLDISSNGGAMAPPTRQVVTDERLGEVVLEGRALRAGDGAGIEGVNINIHNDTDNSLSINTQTDQNGYYAFYESADAANKVFRIGHQYSVNVMKRGYVGSWMQFQYAGTKSTMTVTMHPVDGKIKGRVNIISDGAVIPIPQAWVNVWGDGRNYGTSEDWGDPGNDRNHGMGNASGPVQKGEFLLDGLPSGRYTLNIWSEFNNQPITFNNGPDGRGAVDSNKWDTANTAWGDDFIVEIDTSANGGYARVFTATTPHTAIPLTNNNIVINITKNPDGENTISGQVAFTGVVTPIDPSSVLIVAREDWKNDGTQPKSGFTVLRAEDQVSDNVFNYRIAGLADATYRVEIKAPDFGMKVDNGPRTNEHVVLQGGASATVNFKMAPAGIIEGVLRTPKGTIFTPKFDGPDNMNAHVNADNPETHTWGGGEVDKDGTFRIEGLLPGTYNLRTQGWGESYIYATARLGSVKVEAGNTTKVEIPLRRGVKVHPVLSQPLPEAMQADLAENPQTGRRADMGIVYTPANVALSARNIDEVFHMGDGGDQENTIHFWGGDFENISLEPGAYNFYLVYEKQFPMNSETYSKTIIGSARNVVIDLSKQTDQYAMHGSTMNMVTVQNIPLTLNIGEAGFSGTYAGVNTLRKADLDVIAANFNLFLSYVPRVTLIDEDGAILATGMCTPSREVIHRLGLAGDNNNVDPGTLVELQKYMTSLLFGFSYLPAKERVKAVFTTPNYPPLVKTVSLPGTLAVNMDLDAGAGAKINGTVRNAAQETVAGVTVRIRGRLLDRVVQSESDGTYLIPGLAPGVYRLLVSADGYAYEAEKVIVYNQDTVVNFSLTPCAGSITGTVYSQKFPYPLAVSGAKVVAYDDTANGLDPARELPIYEVVTDNNGSYTISPVVEGHTYKVALVVPGKAVQVYTPSPAVPAAPGSAVAGVDFTYKSMAPKVDLVARPNADGSVTLRGESPKKLISLTAMYHEGTEYSEGSAASLTVSQIGDKTYSFTLPDKARAYAVRFTADDGGSTNSFNIVYDPKNLAQTIANIDQQAVASGEVVLDSQGNDASGLYISPGSMTLGEGSAPQITIEKESSSGSTYASAMDADAVGGDVYRLALSMDGSEQNENKTMTLTLAYDSRLVGDDTGSLSVHQYNPATNAWEPILGAPMVDPISGTVSIEVPSIANATGSAPKRPSQAQFNGREYALSAKRAASANQQGIFMISRAPARLEYAGSSLDVFNTPNPFNLQRKSVTLNRGGSIAQITTDGTVIRFAVPSSFGSNVKTRFRIYNIAGELVRELNANELLAGGVDGGYYYYLDWDGRNADGGKCASGVYLCVAEVGSEKKIIKMALIK